MMRAQNVIFIATPVKCKRNFRNEHSLKCNLVNHFIAYNIEHALIAVSST